MCVVVCLLAAVLRDKVLTAEQFAGVHLVVAGGYDELLPENREHLVELRTLADQLVLSDSHVTFLCNITASEKQHLLTKSTALLYTPDSEHFGIGRLNGNIYICLLYTSPSPRDRQKSRMPSSA